MICQHLQNTFLIKLLNDTLWKIRLIFLGSIVSVINKSMSIVVGEDDNFDINAETGIITTTQVLDFETASRTTFHLTLTVEDSANNADTAILTVHLINVNDNKPVFSSNMYHTSVRENMIDGT